MLVLLLLFVHTFLQATASPLVSQEENVSELEVEHRASVSDAIDDISKQLKDSAVYPILLNPFSVTKLHCGSIVTFYDNSPSDGATVALDVCLTAFIIAKAIFIWEFFVNNLDLDRSGDGANGVFGVLDKIAEFVADLDLAGTGPEGSPFSNLVDSADNKNGHIEDVPVAAKITPNEKFGNMKEINSKENFGQHVYSDDSGYFGFGIDSWKSGPQTFPDIANFASQFSGEVLSRNFAEKMSFEELVRTTVSQLDNVISVETN